MMTTSETARLIDLYVFSKRNREIAKRKIIDGVSYEQVAEEFDLSDRQIKAIIKQVKVIITKAKEEENQ